MINFTITIWLCFKVVVLTVAEALRLDADQDAGCGSDSIFTTTLGSIPSNAFYAAYGWSRASDNSYAATPLMYLDRWPRSRSWCRELVRLFLEHSRAPP